MQLQGSAAQFGQCVAHVPRVAHRQVVLLTEKYHFREWHPLQHTDGVAKRLPLLQPPHGNVLVLNKAGTRSANRADGPWV